MTGGARCTSGTVSAPPGLCGVTRGKSRRVARAKGCLITLTSGITIPGERAGAAFSLSSVLCLRMRALGLVFFFTQRVKHLPLEHSPLPPPARRIPKSMSAGKRPQTYPVTCLELIGAGAGSSRAVRLAGRRRSRNLFAWHSWSRGQTDVRSPQPCSAWRCGDAPREMGPPPPTLPPPALKNFLPQWQRCALGRGDSDRCRKQTRVSLLPGLRPNRCALPPPLLFVNHLEMLGPRALPARKEPADANGGGC